MFAAPSGEMKASTIDCESLSGCCPPLSSAGNYVFSVSCLVREDKYFLCCTLCFHTERRCLCEASVLTKKLALLGYYQGWMEHFAAVITAIDFTFIESCKFTQCLINTKFPGLQLVKENWEVFKKPQKTTKTQHSF